jgi:hypothetical protein
LAASGSNAPSLEDIVALFRSAEYLALEDSISKALGERVVVDAETMAPFAAQELSESGLTLAQLQSLLGEAGPLLIRFGVELNRGEAPFADEEEWDPEEGHQQPAGASRISEGLGVGFGLSYMIFLAKLRVGDDVDLLRYLQGRRIPYAMRFAKRLRTYLERANAA